MSEIGSWMGDVLGIIGIGLAVFFYLRARQTMRVSYEISETMIVGTPGAAFTGDLEIRFKEVDVPRVTSTQLTLWNSGNVTIRRADVAEGDPLALVSSNGIRILQAAVERRTRSVNAVTVSVGNVVSSCLIDFDFLDPGDGFLLNITHTAEVKSIELTGTIIGLRSGFSRIDGQRNNFIDSARNVSFFIMMILLSLISILDDFVATKYSFSQAIDQNLQSFLTIIIGIAIIFYMLFTISVKARWMQKPKNLL